MNSSALDDIKYSIMNIAEAEETGEKASKDFNIKVGKTWKELDAEMVECKCNPK